MSETPKVLDYQGRQTRRTDGHARRQALLEAALRLVAREGIRGVRHRAVAQEAGVPLSATTYYFNDIQDLINDSFLFWAETVIRTAELLQAQSLQALNQIGDAYASDAAARESLAAQLSHFVHAYVEAQVAAREDRLLEQAFRAEALRNPRLAEVVRAPRQALLDTVIGFLRRLGIDEPEADAMIVMGTLMELEYQGCLDGESDPGLIERTIQQLLRRLMA